MARKKSKLQQRNATVTKPPASPPDATSSFQDEPSNPSPCNQPEPTTPISDFVKLECERALSALRRGNYSKALRLIKELMQRHNRSALLYCIHGIVSAKVAALIEVPGIKNRHLKNAIESLRKAVSLSPNSIKYAYFNANLLYGLAAANDGKGYDEVVKECERALLISNPVDPANENLPDEIDRIDEIEPELSTPDTRIAHVQQELRHLTEKSNSALALIRVMNHGDRLQKEKFGLIPVHESEDLMGGTEVPNEIKKADKTQEEWREEIEAQVAAASLLQLKLDSPKPQQDEVPNKIKKADKMQEERRKKIEAQVVAASLLQLKLDSPKPQQDDDRTLFESSYGSLDRVADKRKRQKITNLTPKINWVQKYWNTLSVEKKQSFLEVSFHDLRAHYVPEKDGLAADVLSEALSFAESNKTWKFWACCSCGEKFTDCESHKQHVRVHIGNLFQEMQPDLPKEPDDGWVDMLLNGCWEPVDLHAATQILKNRARHQSLATADSSYVLTCIDGSNEDHLSDDLGSKGMSEVQAVNGESEAGVVCSGGLAESGSHSGISSSDLIGYGNKQSMLAYPILQRWPLVDDPKRAKLLEGIHGTFQLLLKHKCLADSHVKSVIQNTIYELRGLAPDLELREHGLDRTPICICFLSTAQLWEMLFFLQELSNSCQLGSDSEKTTSADDTWGIDTLVGDVLEGITLSDDSYHLILNEFSLSARTISNKAENASFSDGMAVSVLSGDGEPDGDAFLSWMFASSSTDLEPVSWTHLREDRGRRGMEILQMLEKEFNLLKRLCEKKCEHLNFMKALNAILNLCVKGFEKKDHSVEYVAQSYEALLRKRQSELAERKDDPVLINSELIAISVVLQECQASNVTQSGQPGVLSYFCDLESSNEEDLRMQENPHQTDKGVILGIRKLKGKFSLEIGKLDARIRQNLTAIQQLEHELEVISAFDYREILFFLVKAFSRAHLEYLVDKDGNEKSDAAREALLELSLETKGGDNSKQMQEKSKKKKKKKDYRRAKDLKGVGRDRVILSHQETAEQATLFCATDANQRESEIVVTESAYNLKQLEEEFSRKFELEGDEKKLDETLEYQRRIENEPKMKCLAEEYEKVSGKSVTEGSLIDAKSNIDHQDPMEQLQHSKQVNLQGEGSPVSLKGIELAGCHSPQALILKGDQNIELIFGSITPDLLLKSKVERVAFSYDAKPQEPYTDLDLTVGCGLPKDSASLHTKSVERTAVPGKRQKDVYQGVC